MKASRFLEHLRPCICHLAIRSRCLIFDSIDNLLTGFGKFRNKQTGWPFALETVRHYYRMIVLVSRRRYAGRA